MNVILLTPIIFILAPVASETFPSEPCQGTSEEDKYNEFIKRHILQSVFDLNSIDAWKGYLRKFKLCGRNDVQSFINKADEENVLQICSDAGRHLRGNLCISKSTMLVYHVTSTQNCKVVDVNKSEHYVIVACNKIGNQCLPVHYQKYNNECPCKKPCI